MSMAELSVATIESYIGASIKAKADILNDKVLLGVVLDISQICINAYRRGRKVILAGNGGSAADAQHIAAEFVSRFRFDRPGLPSLSLSTDTSMLTAISNDYGYENLFSRQLQANGSSGDVFIGISTSGMSRNLIEAMKICPALGISTVAFTGKTGGLLKDISDYCLCVPSDVTATIQECHIMLGHIVCGFVEDTLFGK